MRIPAIVNMINMNSFGVANNQIRLIDPMSESIKRLNDNTKSLISCCDITFV